MQTRKKSPGMMAPPRTSTRELKDTAVQAISSVVPYCMCPCKEGTRTWIKVGYADVSVTICDGCGGRK